MKLTIYLDQKTTIYYQQMANGLGIPLRTAVKAVLEDLVDKDEEQVKEVLQIVSTGFKEAFTSAFEEAKRKKETEKTQNG